MTRRAPSDWSALLAERDVDVLLVTNRSTSAT